MGIKSITGIFGLLKELVEIRKMLPEIKPVFEYFDKSENPRESLERILDAVKKSPITDDILKITRTYGMITRAEKNAGEKGWNYACLEALKEMGVKVDIIGRQNIPRGSALYISNHPYGLLDSAILIGSLGSLLKEKGERFKVIGMNQLRLIKGIEEIIQFVHTTTSGSNISSLRDSLLFLENGGSLAIYPSGNMSEARLREYPWKNEIIHFIPHSLFIVPMWFSGPDHEKIYNLLARSRKTTKLRRIFSLREAWTKAGKTVTLKIGEPISSEEIMKINGNKEKVQYLRESSESLKI